MFERFTDAARRLVADAQQVSVQLGHNRIDPAHLLLALPRRPHSLGTRAMIDLGVDVADLRQRVLQAIGRGPVGAERTGHVPFTADAKQTLRLSLEEALHLHHDHIGTEHILLGLVRGDKDVAEALLATRADLSQLRQRVEAIVARENGAGAGTSGQGRTPRKITRNLNLTFAAFADPEHPSCPQSLKYVLIKLELAHRTYSNLVIFPRASVLLRW